MVGDWRNRQGMACARNTCMSPDTRISLRDDGSQTSPGVARKVQSVTDALLIVAGMNVVRIPSLWQQDFRTNKQQLALSNMGLRR